MRPALPGDIPVMTALVERSVTRLMAADYSAEQRRLSVGPLFGIDTQLVKDGTYFAVTVGGALAGCGGWSFRRTLFGGDAVAGRDPARADPAADPARLRAFYVDPGCARRGVATLILRHSEAAAVAAGFRRMALGATLTGEPFYRRHGYRSGERIAYALSGGVGFALVRMEKGIG